MDVTPAAFKAISTLDVDAIGQLNADELRPLLPCLVRMGVYTSCHNSPEWANKRKIILQIISQNEEVNSIISLLSVDFHAMEIDVKKELEQKSVLSANLSENLNKNPLNDNNVIISSIVNNLSLDFERSDGFCRMQLIISELFAIQAWASELRSKQSADCLCTSELFDHDVYINELSDVLCIALAELPQTLQLLQVVETLLYVKSGPRLIQRIAANFSDQFECICRSLLEHGDPNEHEDSLLGSVRTHVLRALCRMNPPFALQLRAAAIQMCRLPALCIHLTLDHMQLFAGREPTQDARYVHDLVDFVRGILLGPEQRASCLSALAAIAGNVATMNGSRCSMDGSMTSCTLNGTSDGICHPLDGQMQNAWNDALSVDHETGRTPELHEPVYTLVYQVYERLDRLLGSLDEHQRDGNKELLLLFAHVFTLFNATIGDKIKLQHELDDQRDRCSQISFRLNKEKEYGSRLRDKLEEYETQTQDEIQKYEKAIEELEQRIGRLDKDRRRMHFEQEDTQKELKHLLDGLGRLFELLLEYGSSDCGAGLFFQLARQLLEQTDAMCDARDRLKLLCQLNATLEKRLVDVKHDELRLQEQKILSKIRQNEQKINQIFENGCQSLQLPNELTCNGHTSVAALANGLVSEPGMLVGQACVAEMHGQSGCLRCGSQCLQCEHQAQLQCNYDAVPFAMEQQQQWQQQQQQRQQRQQQPQQRPQDTVDADGKGDLRQTPEQAALTRKQAENEMAERLRQLKELNQTNLSRLLQMEKTVKRGVVGHLDDKSSTPPVMSDRLWNEDASAASDGKSSEETHWQQTNGRNEGERMSESSVFEDEEDHEDPVEPLVSWLVDEYVHGTLRQVHAQHLEEQGACKLSEMLTTGLVKVNDNNEIVATLSPDSKLSQAQLMLINDKLNQSIQDVVGEDTFQEDIHHRFEQSFTEIIRASVSSADATPLQGETLKSILEKSDGDDSMEWIGGDNAPEVKTSKNRLAPNQHELDEIDGQINDILSDISNLSVLGERLYDQKSTPTRPGHRDCGVSTAGLITKHDSGTCTERTKKRDNFTWPMKIGQRHTSTNTAKRLMRNAFTFTEPEVPVCMPKSEVGVQADLPNLCSSCARCCQNINPNSTSDQDQSKSMQTPPKPIVCNGMNKKSVRRQHGHSASDTSVISNGADPLPLDQTSERNNNNNNNNNKHHLGNGKVNGAKRTHLKSAAVQTDFHPSLFINGQTDAVINSNAISGSGAGREGGGASRGTQRATSNQSQSVNSLPVSSEQVPITEVCWRIPSLSFMLTILCYVFCFLKHLAFGVVFLCCSLVFLTQLLFSTTRIPPFHSWEEIIVKMLDPYLTKERVY